jgi:hypothetical protein
MSGAGRPRPRPHRHARPPVRVLAVRWAVVLSGVAVVVFAAVLLTSGTPPATPARHHSSTTTTVAPATSASTTTARPARLVASTASWHLASPVSRAVVVADGKDLLVLGGLTTGDVSTAQVVQVDPASGTSTPTGQLTTAVHDAGGVSVGGRVLVFGGGSYSTVSLVQAWSAGAVTTVGALPVARSDLAAAVVGGTAYVVGGFDGTNLVSAVVATRDGASFQPAGQLVQPVRYPAVAAVGSEIWVVGGQLGTAESTRTGGQTSDIQVYDPATGTTRVVGNLPVPLGHAAAFTLGGQLYVAGGRNGDTATTQIWRISPTGTTTLAGSLPFAFSDMAAVVLGQTAWLVGGETTGPTAPLDTVVEVRLAS